MEVNRQRIAYGGWRDCLRLANDTVEAVLTTAVGPRVISYGFIGGENGDCAHLLAGFFSIGRSSQGGPLQIISGYRLGAVGDRAGPVAELVLTGKMGQTLFQNKGRFSKEPLISLKKRQSLFPSCFQKVSVWPCSAHGI